MSLNYELASKLLHIAARQDLRSGPGEREARERQQVTSPWTWGFVTCARMPPAIRAVSNRLSRLLHFAGSEFGTYSKPGKYETVGARFWPWLAGGSP